jgi:hypothetical protein
MLLSILTLFTTLSAWVDFMASMMVGLVFTPPRCLKQPKNFSSGSWLSLSLKKKDTPGIFKINGTNSKNEFTACMHA